MTTYTEDEQERVCQVKNNHPKEVKAGDSAEIDTTLKSAKADFFCWAGSDPAYGLVGKAFMTFTFMLTLPCQDWPSSAEEIQSRWLRTKHSLRVPNSLSVTAQSPRSLCGTVCFTTFLEKKHHLEGSAWSILPQFTITS